MKAAVKAAWLERLRSGEIRQGRGALAVFPEAPYNGVEEPVVPEGAVPAFCCLGVLCELLVPQGLVKGEESVIDVERAGFYYGQGIDTLMLPREAARMAGLVRPGVSDGEIEMSDPLVKYYPETDPGPAEPNDKGLWPMEGEATHSDERGDFQWVPLSRLNDAGYSFAQVADFIERDIPADEEETA